MKIARKHIAAAIDAELTELDPLARRQTRSEICELTDPARVRETLRALFAPQEPERLAA
jgi:hypothetical protein